jgi:hypothetical protein
MPFYLRRMRLMLACMLAAPVVRLAAQPVPAPEGWTATRSGANWIYTPSTLPTGSTFTLTIEPVQALDGQDVQRWLTAHARDDVGRHGAQVGATNTQHNPNGAWITQLGYRDSQGEQWIALYTAVPRPNGSVQCSDLATNLSASAATSYARTAGTIIGSMPTTVATLPAGDGNIAAVLHEGRGQSTATGYAYVESADLLLKDGWAYLGLTTPPEYLDEAASRQREPSKWHRWKSEGNVVLIETGGQWTKLDADRVRPLPAGAALSIPLIHRHSTGFGGMGSYNTSQTITFEPSGRYARSSGVIAGTGAVQAGGGFSGGAGSFQDQHQSGSASSGSNGTVTTTTRSHGQGDANLAGTYKVTGYTLELDGAGGAVQRVLAFYPFSDNNSVYIDGVTYNRQ